MAADADPLAEAVQRARLWLARYDATHPATPRERLDDVVNRLSAKYLPREDRLALTLIRGERDDG